MAGVCKAWRETVRDCVAELRLGQGMAGGLPVSTDCQLSWARLFLSARSVTLQGGNATDELMLEVARHLSSSLQSLQLRSCDLVTNMGVSMVAWRCRELTTVCLHQCRALTAATLAVLLRALPRLRELSIIECPRILRRLSLKTRSGLQEHCGVRRLHIASAYYRIQTADLQALLAAMPRIEQLILEDVPCVVHVVPCVATYLRILQLCTTKKRTMISNAGLEASQGLPICHAFGSSSCKQRLELMLRSLSLYCGTLRPSTLLTIGGLDLDELRMDLSEQMVKDGRLALLVTSILKRYASQAKLQGWTSVDHALPHLTPLMVTFSNISSSCLDHIVTEVLRLPYLTFACFLERNACVVPWMSESLAEDLALKILEGRTVLAWSYTAHTAAHRAALAKAEAELFNLQCKMLGRELTSIH
eukprot:SM000074S21640  [mRNA]  locus=s74:7158:9682:- [translate_table: standard]